MSFTSSGFGGGDGGGGGSSLFFGHKSAEMIMTMTAAAAATPVFLQRRFGCCLECARSTLAPPLLHSCPVLLAPLLPLPGAHRHNVVYPCR